MNSFVLFGDGAITRKKNNKKHPGNFASCATRNDAVFRHFFFRVILHHQTNKKKKDSLNNSISQIKHFLKIWIDSYS
jgi:hypothetical protein